MKHSLPSIIAGASIIVILVLYMITYQVRFNEVAVVRTFGEITPPDPQTHQSDDVITEPGLKWKWPWPIQRVMIYDNRVQITTTTGEETPTRDGKNVVLTTAIGWRIDDPYTFSIRCADMKDAQNKLKTRVRNDQKTVIGQYDFANFVSIDQDELQYDKIENEILEAVKDSARDLYGIRIESIGIAKLALPQRITETVFEAMKKERQAVAAKYTSEGESRAKQIIDTAEAIAGTIMAFAERRATEIVAEGQRRAAKYNEVLSKDEKLAMFLLEVENLAEILKERTTIVLDANQGLFGLLNEESVAGPTTRPASKISPKAASSVPPPGMLKSK